jgi:hypothetical protein
MIDVLKSENHNCFDVSTCVDSNIETGVVNATTERLLALDIGIYRRFGET